MRFGSYVGAGAIALLAAQGMASAAMSPGSDALNLTNTQRHEIYQDVSQQNTGQTAPVGFTARVGDAVPGSIKINPLPAKATNHVPAVKGYDFAILKNKVLLVSPNDKKVVDIITQ